MHQQQHSARRSTTAHKPRANPRLSGHGTGALEINQRSTEMHSLHAEQYAALLATGSNPLGRTSFAWLRVYGALSACLPLPNPHSSQRPAKQSPGLRPSTASATNTSQQAPDAAQDLPVDGAQGLPVGDIRDHKMRVDPGQQPLPAMRGMGLQEPDPLGHWAPLASSSMPGGGDSADVHQYKALLTMSPCSMWPYLDGRWVGVEHRCHAHRKRRCSLMSALQSRAAGVYSQKRECTATDADTLAGNKPPCDPGKRRCLQQSAGLAAQY